METITFLEDELANDILGLKCREYIECLTRAAAEQCVTQNATISPESERRRQACLAAIRIIELIWRTQHEL